MAQFPEAITKTERSEAMRSETQKLCFRSTHEAAVPRSRVLGIAGPSSGRSLLFGMGYIILFPILVKISSSFMGFEDLFDSSVNWIPRRFTLEHYQTVFLAMEYPKTLLHSAVFAGGVSILQVASCIFVGYGLARFDFPGKRLLFACVIFTLIVPPELMLAPLYINLRYFDLWGLIPGGGFNLLNTQWPFYLMAVTGTGIRNGIFIYLMRQFFKGIPKSLEEAAYVDARGPFSHFLLHHGPGGPPACARHVCPVVCLAMERLLFTRPHSISRAQNFLTHKFLGVNIAFAGWYARSSA